MSGVIVETGEFETDDGRIHGFLPSEPPESPPNNFHWDGKTYDVDPEQCAAYYRGQGKALPEKVTLYLPDGTSEEHDWVGYGRRFREIAQAVAAGKPIPPHSPGA